MQQGCEVVLLCRANSILAEKAGELAIPMIPVNRSQQAVRELFRYGQKFDIIHPQGAKTLTWAAITKWKHNRPIVYTRRVDFVPSGPFTLWKYKQADCIVAISNAIKDILHKQGIHHVEMIPSVVEELPRNHHRAKQECNNALIANQRIIGTVAALVPHKNPATMVEAVSELAKIRTDFVFLHFGDGPLRDRIQELIRQKNLQNIYRLFGFREHVEDFYTLFNVFVMSSQEEGLGSSVLDAFLYKVPVATTDAGGLQEIVTNNGLVSPVRDPKALAENINKLLNEPQLCQRLTERAYKHVKLHHDPEQVTRKYLSLYKRLLE